MKERIVEFEQVLLRTINFQVDPLDPYRLLLNYARSLRLGRATTRTAWGLANDVLFCPRALSAPPPAVACAAIRMAARVHGADRRLRWFSPPIRKKRRRADDDRDRFSRGFGGGGGSGRFDNISGLGAAAGCWDGGGGGGSVSGAGSGGGGSSGCGGGGDGNGEEQHGKGEREMGGDRRGDAAVAAAVAARATAHGEGAPGATSLPDCGDHDSFVSDQEAVITGGGVRVEAGAGVALGTAVGKSGCPPVVGPSEDSSAGRKEGQKVVGEAAAAAACGEGVSVIRGGGNGSGGGSGGSGRRDSGRSGGDGSKDDEREVMPWWGLFDARDEEIEMVCSELLALYRDHDASGCSKGIGSRSNDSDGADRDVTPSRRQAGDSAEGHSSAAVAGDRSRANGLGGQAGGQGLVEEVSCASSADSSRRRNGNRQ